MTKKEMALKGLQRAKQLLSRDDGWIKESYFSPEGEDSYCLVGAYMYAMTEQGISDGYDDPEALFMALDRESYITLAFGDKDEIEEDTGGFTDVTQFNDAKDRQKPDVLNYLTLRISRLESSA